MPESAPRGRLLGGALVLALSCALSCALAGCVSAVPTAPHHSTPAVGTPSSVAVPAHIPNDPVWRADATMRSCAAASGGWKASGRLENSSTATHSYLVTVLFTTDQATVIGVGMTRVEVAPGGHRDWSVSARFAAAAPTLCVLSGVA